MIKQQGIIGQVKNTPSFADINAWKNYKPVSVVPEVKLPTFSPLGWANAGLSGLTSGFQNFNAINSDSINNTIDNASNIEVSAVNENDLINQLNNQQMLDTDYSMKDMGWNLGEQLGNIGSAALSGLATGNPYAALLSGGLAAVGSVVGGIKAHNEAKKAEDRALAVNKATNYKYQQEAADLYKNQFKNMLVNTVAEGGNLNNMFNTGFININNGGTHEENPFGGVPMGVDNQGIPNLVEEGEVVYNDYVYSNRLKLPKSYIEKYKLGKDKLTFADAAKDIQKSIEESPNDPITKRGVESRMEELRQLHEEEKMKKETKRIKKEVNKFSPGGDLKTGVDWMKYGPMIANATGILQNIATPYDFEYANKIESAAKRIPGITASTISGKLPYTAIDNDYILAKQIAESNASRNGLLNLAANAGAARASILASDHNLINALGETYAKNAVEDRAARLQNAQYNLAIDQYNAQAKDSAAKFNAELAKLFQEAELKNLYTSAALRGDEKAGRATSLGTNLNAFADNLYQLYRDNVTDQQVDFYNTFGRYLNPEGKKLAEKYMKDKSIFG